MTSDPGHIIGNKDDELVPPEVACQLCGANPHISEIARFSVLRGVNMGGISVTPLHDYTQMITCSTSYLLMVSQSCLQVLGAK